MLIRLVSVALVAFTMAAQAADQPAWLTYNKDYDGQRYSFLNEINTKNVASLKKVCTLQLGDPGAFQTGPIVIGDTMYVTTAHTTVALNATDCSVRWRSVYMPEDVEAWPVNRGAAYLDGRIFRGTGDSRVIALDSHTGRQIWKSIVGNPKRGDAVPSAPIAWKGKVYISAGIGEFGSRGRMLALDAETGRILWQFNLLPTGAERGANTWRIPPDARRAGAASWSTYTLDPAHDEVLVPVGNPTPMMDASVRPGDNLYTNSIVALNAQTGALRWWYQTVPADRHDRDLAAAAVIYKSGRGQPMVAVAGKDGFLHAIDRTTHKVVFKTPVTTMKNTDVPFTAEGVDVCPGVLGGVQWNGPAFDPSNNQLYVGAVDWCAKLMTGEKQTQNGEPLGGQYVPIGEAQGWITAIDASSGRVRWRYHSNSPIVAALTPTAGGVVFAGDVSGNFLAFESKTGELLLRDPTGGSVAGGVVTYSLGSRQYVATTSGNISKFTFSSSLGPPKIVIYSLRVPSSGAVIVDAEKVQGVTNDSQPSATQLADGRQNHAQSLFASFCSACHGMQGQGGIGPALTAIHERRTIEQVVAQIKSPAKTMPRLYPSPLSEEDVNAVARYVETF